MVSSSFAIPVLQSTTAEPFEVVFLKALVKGVVSGPSQGTRNKSLPVCLSPSFFGYLPLDQRSVNLFFKGTDSKYFRICWSYVVFTFFSVCVCVNKSKFF